MQMVQIHLHRRIKEWLSYTANILPDDDLVMQGVWDPVSIYRPSFPGMGIPMLKMRWSRDHLIFNMGISKQCLYSTVSLYWDSSLGIKRTAADPVCLKYSEAYAEEVNQLLDT